MTTVTFDTLRAAHNLKVAGVEAGQAEAIVTTMSEAFSDTVATKGDISEVKAEVANLKVEVKAEVANLKAEIFRALWIQGAGLVGLQLTIAGLLFAAIRFF